MYIFLLFHNSQDFLAPIQDLFHLNLNELALTLARKRQHPVVKLP